MILAICGSMVFTKEMLAVQNQLEKQGHQVFISGFAKGYRGKSAEEIEKLTIRDKKENDAILDHWEKIQKSDAILVLNYDRKGIKNYLGGNTLMELGFAYVLNKKIYLLNPVPEIEYYQSEIEAVRPMILTEIYPK